ncbi:solute carrier family 35 member G1-like [Brevipalpus obovatus]|uniref:solute carrier family 35 member G1-like n=1 Tax=Brevipalpus obovatus TaxID=246614 RepID=UPI003D9ECAFA
MDIRSKPSITITEEVSIDRFEMGSRKNSFSRRKSSVFYRASLAFNSLRKESVVMVITFWQSFKGVLFSIVAAFLFSTCDVMVKSLTGISPSLIALFRFGGMGLFSLAALSEVKVDESLIGPKSGLIWAVLRGLNGAFSLFFYYITLQLLPLANAIIITLSIPVFVCVFAHFFLREPCGIFHVLALSVTLIGIGMTAKLDLLLGLSDDPSDDHHMDRGTQLLGLSCGLASALTGSFNFLIVRQIKHVHHLIILSNYAWVAAIGMAVITYFMDGFGLPKDDKAPWCLMMMGMLSFYGQVLFTKALQVEEAGIIAVVRSSCELILAFVFQVTLFHQIPDFSTVLGALLVVVAVLLTSLRKYIITLAPDHFFRRWFAFTLK